MEKEKVCKYCGTTKEEDFIRKNFKIGVTICTKCLCNHNSKENNPSWKGGPINKIGECKYCGTTNEEDFIRKSGKSNKTVCVKCYSKNLSKVNSGENNPGWKGGKIEQNKKCKQCGTEKEEDFIRNNGKGTLLNICAKCYCKNLSNKMSEISKKGETHHSFGKSPSEKTRKQISETLSDGRRKGENHPMYNSHHSLDHKLRNSKSLRHSSDEFKEKYHLLYLVEEIRELPEEEWKIGMSNKQFRCKRCNEWFTPTQLMVSSRNQALNKNKDNCYLYCSDECKNSCSLFALRSDYFLNNLNHKESETISQTDYKTFRKEVLNRQLTQENICFNHCEICNSEINLHVHHELPQKTHPHLALDPDNGIILCSSCHHIYGHQDNCSTGQLKNIICK